MTKTFKVFLLIVYLKGFIKKTLVKLLEVANAIMAAIDHSGDYGSIEKAESYTLAAE